ncbi:Beta-ketoadipate enol-lactone hydrolase (plasmid) [Cupriavidus necator H850]|uniref:3-oxoadipate enol-lactonase n=1 Tax=Cupriavidus necator TaxID=106590 RepID=UPI00129DED70|nr:3-oxoadipate enol-lactonase [Cupriavidus necator]KAI3605922.1 Beta-ketoadipate enol-lactone hydrolase [Cupriavidus necator H850]
MSTATHGDLRINYELEGPADAPVLVMSNSLGTTLAMWDPQMPVLRKHFRVLRYDTRGHGASTESGQRFGIEDLGDDVLAVMDHAGVQRAHFCGLSMGGMTGMWLARHYPNRFDRFVLANTAALIGPASGWNSRIELVQRDGMAAIVDSVLARWFTPAYLAGDPARLAPVRTMLLQANATGYTASCAAVRDADLRALLQGIEAEVLVIAGMQDAGTTPEQGLAVACAIPHAAYISLAAAHLSNWELPQAFADAVTFFLLRS